MLGFTGTFRGKPVSVQATGMGCPPRRSSSRSSPCSASRPDAPHRTCGGLQPDLALGDLIVAISAVPADSTALHITGEIATAGWGSSTPPSMPRRSRQSRCASARSSRADVFYNSDDGQYRRWSDRGVAVEMEAAVLFTLGALRKVQAGCLLTVSDVVVEGEFVRITDEEMKAAVDQMTELALEVATG